MIQKQLRVVFAKLGLETVWVVYWLFTWGLTTLVHTKCAGVRPKPPCVLAVTHVGAFSFEPLFVARATRHWRGWALYSIDRPSVIVRFICRACWRFGVTQDPVRKHLINPQTLERAVQHLRKGGSLMVFPEGDRFPERRLYRGAALLAKRANVPLIPVGLENAILHRLEDEGLPLWRMFPRALWKTLCKRWIAVHFAAPIIPNPNLSEEEDVDRMMRELEHVFREFYQRFYGLPGPTWVSGKKLA